MSDVLFNKRVHFCRRGCFVVVSMTNQSVVEYTAPERNLNHTEVKRMQCEFPSAFSCPFGLSAAVSRLTAVTVLCLVSCGDVNVHIYLATSKKTIIRNRSAYIPTIHGQLTLPPPHNKVSTGPTCYLCGSNWSFGDFSPYSRE